jgi:hypothetical protein
MKRAEGNYLMATNFRTKYANTLFNPASVAAAIDEVAFNGHRYYRVVQEHPFDLSDTDAATALEEWLDREQFHYIWRPTFVEHDASRPSQVSEYPELVVTW